MGLLFYLLPALVLIAGCAGIVLWMWRQIREAPPPDLVSERTKPALDQPEIEALARISHQLSSRGGADSCPGGASHRFARR
ncbi:MAG: hypothetical protein CME06_04965, partial [Gemmatimonadetes bacterium]|nr:hypothetical protein [Gemmatimonadota bacterium]